MAQNRKDVIDFIKGLKIYFAIGLLIIVIILQIRLINTIVMHYTDLEVDPFVYGAKRLGIKEANCFIKEDVMLFFNQSESKFIITNHEPRNSLESYFKE